MKKLIFLAGLMFYEIPFLFPLHGLAQTWQKTSAPETYWSSIACSADGRTLVAGAWFGTITASTNGGATWTTTIPQQGAYRFSLACSANGTKLVAARWPPGSISTSTNSGLTWELTSAPDRVWRSVASSADGTKLVAAATANPAAGITNEIYTSTNSGVSWALTIAPDAEWASVASSVEGTKLVAAASSGLIVVSIDSGITWTATSAPGKNWNSVASSANGNILAAVDKYDGTLSTSTNSGTTWTTTNITSGYIWCSAAASSADGANLAALLTPSGEGLVQTLLSTNAGGSWSPTIIDSGKTNDCGIASSADGNKLVAALYNMGIYIRQSTPTPLLHIALSEGNPVLSWTVPSMNFALQQSSDLTAHDWVDVAGVPVMTNLDYKLTISNPNGTMFYRLISR